MKDEGEIKILLVDDEPDNLLLLDAILRSPNLDIHSIQTGYEALSIIQEYEFALVIMDVQMPKMNGFEAATKIRKSKKGSEVPIIFVTAYNNAEEHVFQGYESGAVDYLFKPVNPNILRHKVSVFVDMFRNKQLLIKKSDELEVAFESQRNATVALQKRTDELHETQGKLENANRELRELNQKMHLDLKQAQKTQLALLPGKFPQLPYIHIAAIYESVQQIGGDFYDIFDLGSNRVGILLVDVTGHDTSAALVSFMVAGLFKTFASDYDDIIPLIKQINGSLYGSMPGSRFATVFYCIYDYNTNQLDYASYGHPEGYVLRQGEVFPLKKGGPPLGIFSNDQGKFDAGSIKIKSGDKLFLYTDGIVEMKDSNHKMFGRKRLAQFLNNQSHLTGADFLDNLYKHVLEYAQAIKFDDDITLVTLDFQ